VGLGDTASAVGKGLFAGAAGTVAMTASSTLEAKLRERGSSSAPADAAGKKEIAIDALHHVVTRWPPESRSRPSTGKKRSWPNV
jgi:hypothetical protein